MPKRCCSTYENITSLKPRVARAVLPMDERAERCERQILLPQIGEQGQKKLARSSALVVGCGGLASTLLWCLCGMGVGRIGFCDGDVVARSNLNRQFLHNPRDIGRKKAQSAYEKLRAFAPELTLEPMSEHLTKENAETIVAGYGVVVLAVDSLPARLLVNRACVRRGVPLVDGGINGLHGTLHTVLPGRTACLHCLYGEMEPPHGPIPSFAPVVSTISALEAQACADVLLGLPNPSAENLLLYDGAQFTLERVAVRRREDCPVCGASRN